MTHQLLQGARARGLHRTRVLAEQLLSAAFGGRVRLDGGHHVGDRAHVVRFGVVAAPPTAPASVIVKRARRDQPYDPQARNYPASAWLLFNEWAGLDFLGRIDGASDVAPRLYAGDGAAGIVVLEDLGTGTRLDTLLLGRDPIVAEDALLGLARTLGRLHALTKDGEDQFERVRAALGPRTGSWVWMPPWMRHAGRGRRHRRADGTDLPATPASLAARFSRAFLSASMALGVVPAPGADAEVRALATALGETRRFWAFIHGDPCPGNELIVDDHLHLVDFELAAYRPALLEGVYGRMHFPTCWCVNRLPEQVVRQWEAVYRAELVSGFPEAGDDELFGRALVDACAYWTLNLCEFDQISHLLGGDVPWSLASMRQRVLLRFAIFARTTEEFGHLEALGATVQRMEARLRARWPAPTAVLPPYPAFR